VLAQSGSIHLLAVSDTGGVYEGQSAQLFLEITPGQGRVFIETIPLSKVDTQLSTRFAQQTACKYANVDCSKLDFFYTIKSSAALIGGPSAGAATAGLTVAVLKQIEVKQDVAITGTINSGYLIGEIGHPKEKIDAAVKENMTIVLIPQGQAEYTDENNHTFDLYTVGRLKGIKVIEVSDLDDVMTAITGENFTKEKKELVIPEFYQATMGDVATNLCEQTITLRKEILSLLDTTANITTTMLKTANESMIAYEESKILQTEGKYYAQASRCFSANVGLRSMIYTIQQEYIPTLQETIRQSGDALQQSIEEQPLTTVTDLQTRMIALERVYESQNSINKTSYDELAYAYERLHSAESWSIFFGKPGVAFTFNNATLKNSCEQKIGEVQEVYNYLTIILPQLSKDTSSFENVLYRYEQQDYVNCLYDASLLLADLQSVSSSLGVTKDLFPQLVERKLQAAQMAIADEIDKGTFPMAAYSYYELGQSFKTSSPAMSLVYAEYALELSNHDIYFEKQKKVTSFKFTIPTYLPEFLLFCAGLFLGLAIALSRKKKGPIRLR